MTRISLCGCLQEPVLGLLGEAAAFVQKMQARYQSCPECEALARRDPVWRERRPL